VPSNRKLRAKRGGKLDRPSEHDAPRGRFNVQQRRFATLEFNGGLVYTLIRRIFPFASRLQREAEERERERKKERTGIMPETAGDIFPPPSAPILLIECSRRAFVI